MSRSAIGFVDLEPFLDRKRNELLEKLSQFTDEELVHVTETAGSWTPVHMLEHLAIVEARVVSQVESMLRIQHISQSRTTTSTTTGTSLVHSVGSTWREQTTHLLSVMKSMKTPEMEYT